jgi:hypothetical protein
MSFSIKDSVLSSIEKDIINTILIRICINTVFFPIYCVILIILQKEYLDLMREVEGHDLQWLTLLCEGQGTRGCGKLKKEN